MKERIYTIHCKKCGSDWVFKGQSLINSQLESEYKSKIKDGSFFRRKCSKCGEIITFTYPFIYQDIKRHLALVIDLPQLKIEGYKILYFNDHISMSEGLKIIDDDLDFDQVNELKAKLAKYQKLIYQERDEEFLYFDSEKGIIAIKIPNNDFILKTN